MNIETVPAEDHVGALTLSGFCRLFNVGRTLTYSEIASGRLTAKKIGKRTVILRSEAARWAEALPALKCQAAARQSSRA